MNIKIPSGPAGSKNIEEIDPSDETQPGAVEAKPTSGLRTNEALSGIDAVARDVSAGRISANEAVDKILADTIGHRSVREAPEELRLELAEALETLVQNDPRLKSLVQALGVTSDE